ncbi:glycosyltransferase family 2 protein [Alteraurantiacibacter aquimixticola]|uniref:glycosyltransferase family 2 protein n=1 Tax=Alteraurantiacibacter aquimixticola TaxID=2489173 RepID=UPI00145B9796|nr:glycosyltransferase family 2 protein [Alteraurantiacibacter aquimixticola]
MSIGADPNRGIAVIIAAYNAAGTIGRAVRSALAEPEVAEVIVIDDCSSDKTVEAARLADDQSGRLRILTQDRNGGPAAARNRGFAEASSPFVAVLDSDDFLLPGRFSRLLDLSEAWDIAADNIMFVLQGGEAGLPLTSASAGAERALTLADFVEANISRFGRQRAELGFLKPVFRRSFLQQHGLLYDSSLRLGEDFALYLRALISGARFRITSGCGYVAVERPDSLSGQHRTEDLAALRDSDNDLLAGMDRGSPAYASVRRHRDHIARRYLYRAFLDERRRVGIARAFRSYLGRPGEVLSILHSNALDRAASWLRRVRRQRRAGQALRTRYLMET